ncbi:MAG: prepilin-type N-terminal cleavage/methylation domain-containing protein [Bdellovibrionaceae bacterium]|jgi:type IV pilus assembly protein PilA|nr:prepilin-type N-terminal cleavage/methylation domain-containing protein [Pseudobdellovibrionaceae bacterium]
MKKNVIKSQKGFSLIELMVVVAIIGILASVAVPNFQRFQAKSRQSEAKTLLTGLYTAEKAFFTEWDQYFSDFRDIGFQPEGQVAYTVGFNATGNAAPADLNYSGIVAANGAAVQWNTTIFCAAAGTCSENADKVCTTAATDLSADGTFIAGACGNVDGDAGLDVWTINQNKALANGTNDVVL